MSLTADPIQKRSAQSTSAAAGSSGWIGAPIAGWVTPLTDVADPVFAGRVLGDGIAIDPFETILRAPCAGTIVTLHRAHHAVTLRTDNGVDLLMHIGLDTVALNGDGFMVHIAQGQKVEAGDALISFDLASVSGRVPSLVTPVIVTNGDAVEIVARAPEGEIAAGDNLMQLRPLGAARDSAVAADAPEARLVVSITAPHGIHARPAGTIVQCARGFASEVTLQAKGRSISGRSAVGIMSLGVESGDEVTVLARGTDADAAVKAVGAMLASHFGDAAEAGAAPPRAAPAAAPAAPAAPPKPATAFAAPLPPFAAGTEVVLSGVTAAPGLALGHAVRIEQKEIAVAEAGAGLEAERSRLKEALATAEADLNAKLAAEKDKTSAAHGILSAHLAFLDDPDLRDRAEQVVSAGKSAGFAWHTAIEEQAAVLQGLGNVRFVERVNDLRDVDRRIQAALTGEKEQARVLPQDAVLVATDLLPSEFASLDASRIAGICTAAGGPTSHVSILAGSRGIPALVAVGADALRIPDGAPVLLDADRATARVFPSKALVASTREAIATRSARLAANREQAMATSHTADGVRIEVVANLGGVKDVPGALAAGAEGCGLLRSEFLFLNRESEPTEDEQAAQYQAIATGLEGRPLIIRTLDAGADKELPYLGMEKDENPQLGVRGLRLGLIRPNLLRAQLRAILRVRPLGQAKIMLPMVASVDELRTVRAMLDEEKAGLGVDYPVSLGIMIEVPSAAVMADVLAAEADFFSVGTNDLTQYVLAMDRLNPTLAKQVDALHPAVLRLIGQTAEGARKHGRWVGVCGSLASVPLGAPVLIGLGVTELSSAAAAVPQVKAMVRTVTMAECRAAAEEAVQQESAAAVRAVLAKRWPNA